MTKGMKGALVGGALLAAAAVLVLRAGGGDAADALPSGEADAVAYRCSEDGTEFRMTPADLERARRKVPTELGVAPCPKCGKATGLQAVNGEVVVRGKAGTGRDRGPKEPGADVVSPSRR